MVDMVAALWLLLIGGLIAPFVPDPIYERVRGQRARQNRDRFAQGLVAVITFLAVWRLFT